MDASARPERVAGYLASVARARAVQAAKRGSIDRLRLRPGQRVLDVGCGLGDEVRAMAATVGAPELAVGVDSSRELLARARELGGCFEHGSALALPFPDGSFDACRAERLLVNLDRPQTACREMARVLRSGGRVSILEMTVLSDADDPQLAWLTARLDGGGDAPGPGLAAFIPGLLKRAGFIDVEVEASDAPVDEPEELLACLDLQGALAEHPRPDELRRWAQAPELAGGVVLRTMLFSARAG